MGKSIQLKLVALVHLFSVATVFAYAADAKDFVAGMESIPILAFKYVAGVAFAFGSAATLIKVARHDINLKYLPIEILKDLVCSVGAGILIFSFGVMFGLPVWPQFISVMLAGFGGPQVLDMALSKGLMPWLSNILGRFANSPPQQPQQNKSTETP